MCRGIWLATFGALLLRLGAFETTGHGEEDAAAEKIVIGPLLLGDSFKNMDESCKLIGCDVLISKGGGPAKHEIIQALNDCKIYCIHARKRIKQGEWEFMDQEPQIVVEGKCSFELKDAKGKNFSIHIKVVELAALDYHLDAQTKRAKLCCAGIVVKLTTSPYRIGDGEWTDLNFFFRPVCWDTSGKIRQEPKKGD